MSKLSERLVLNRYLLDLFGFADFSELKDRLSATQEGSYTDGISYFANTIIGWENLKIPQEQILIYDRAINEYSNRLSTNRRENINLKYFQYLAVLFTEIFLYNYFNHRQEFLTSLNYFVDSLNSAITHDKDKFSYFNEADLQKLAFWMATGSGKTLIMHINC